MKWIKSYREALIESSERGAEPFPELWVLWDDNSGVESVRASKSEIEKLYRAHLELMTDLILDVYDNVEDEKNSITPRSDAREEAKKSIHLDTVAKHEIGDIFRELVSNGDRESIIEIINSGIDPMVGFRGVQEFVDYFGGDFGWLDKEKAGISDDLWRKVSSVMIRKNMF